MFQYTFNEINQQKGCGAYKREKQINTQITATPSLRAFDSKQGLTAYLKIKKKNMLYLTKKKKKKNMLFQTLQCQNKEVIKKILTFISLNNLDNQNYKGRCYHYPAFHYPPKNQKTQIKGNIEQAEPRTHNILRCTGFNPSRTSGKARPSSTDIAYAMYASVASLWSSVGTILPFPSTSPSLTTRPPFPSSPSAGPSCFGVSSLRLALAGRGPLEEEAE